VFIGIDIRTQSDESTHFLFCWLSSLMTTSKTKKCWRCIFLGDKLHYVMGKTVCGREVETEICILKCILFILLCLKESQNLLRKVTFFILINMYFYITELIASVI
jgi:hypothetical protein